MNMTVVTVLTGKQLTLDVNGFLEVYVAGDTVSVPTYAVVYLRRDGIIA